MTRHFPFALWTGTRRPIPAIIAAILLAAAPCLALAQTLGGSYSLQDCSDPPVTNPDLRGGGTTWTVSGGTVRRASGNATVPTWVSTDNARVEIAGVMHLITGRTGDDTFTIDDARVRHSGVPVYIGARPSIPHDNVDDTATIQAFFDSISASQRGVLFFPPQAKRGEVLHVDAEGYEISSTITIGPGRALRLIGSGLRWNNGSANETLFTWKGGSGPMFHLQGTSGLQWEGLNCIGNSRLRTMLKITDKQPPGADLGRQQHFKESYFSTARTLFEIGHSGGGPVPSGAADILWTHCMFQDVTDASNSNVEYAAVHTTNEQVLSLSFYACQWNNINTCIWLQFGGYLRVREGGIGNCGLFVKRDQGSNTAGTFIEYVYHDNSNNRRMIWYRSGNEGSGAVYGPIVFRGIVLQSSYPSDANQNRDVTGVVGNTITVDAPLLLAKGDTLAFWEDQNPRGMSPVASATITRVNSSTSFDVDSTSGITDSLWANEDNSPGFSVLESYVDNGNGTGTITMVDDLNIMIGDHISFHESNDYNGRVGATPETVATVTAKTGTGPWAYTVDLTPAEAGVATQLANGTLRVAHGTPLFYGTGGERFEVSNCLFQPWTIQGKRLAKLQQGTAGSGRDTIVYVDRCIGFWRADPADLARHFLDIEDAGTDSTGLWYRFRDITNTSASQPTSYSNIPEE